ncbi:hypothetical protein ND16A_3408 [Thalassotalea sp. ND16A]|nr:hypothetical protein ND16A_3408 [Thalassotalea sp. ND16A]
MELRLIILIKDVGFSRALYTRATSKCKISVGVKSNIGKALNLENGCSIVKINNAA